MNLHENTPSSPPAATSSGKCKLGLGGVALASLLGKDLRASLPALRACNPPA
jgi:hypothetical protein